MTEKDKPLSREFFVEQGRRGGKTRAENMTKKDRSEAARKAVLARWAKKKTK